MCHLGVCSACRRPTRRSSVASPCMLCPQAAYQEIQCVIWVYALPAGGLPGDPVWHLGVCSARRRPTRRSSVSSGCMLCLQAAYQEIQCVIWVYALPAGGLPGDPVCHLGVCSACRRPTRRSSVASGCMLCLQAAYQKIQCVIWVYALPAGGLPGDPVWHLRVCSACRRPTRRSSVSSPCMLCPQAAYQEIQCVIWVYALPAGGLPGDPVCHLGVCSARRRPTRRSSVSSGCMLCPQAAYQEIQCGIWVRNGLQMRGQAITYIQCHFCNAMVDADLYLLQVNLHLSQVHPTCHRYTPPVTGKPPPVPGTPHLSQVHPTCHR